MIEEIPRSFLYTCDRCRKTHEQRAGRESGHYTESTPPGWLTIRLIAASSEDDRKLNALRHEALCCPTCRDMVLRKLFELRIEVTGNKGEDK